MKNWIGCLCLLEYLSYVIWLCFVYLLVMQTVILIFYCSYYLMGLYVYLYKKMNSAPDDMLTNSWHRPRYVLSRIWCQIARVLNGYEIVGMKHIPEGPGLIIFYHGALASDYFYFICNLYLKTGRLCHSVLDNIIFILPGLKSLINLWGGTRGSKEECLEILKNGHLLGISPGGMREAIFSDHHYDLIWGNRTGFAQVAIEAKVPIIPMFTQNIREECRTIGRTRLSRWVYERTRKGYLLVSGYFPVKLCTYIGEPIPYDPNITAQELAAKTKTAIENLRNRYQKVPGSILAALAERFEKHPKDN